IGNPAEPDVESARRRKGYIKLSLDTSGITFSDNPKLIENRKESGYHFTVDSVLTFQAIFFTPKQVGKGFTGIYIDSIGQIAGNLADLVLYSENLNGLENAEIEKIVRSLVLKTFE